MKPEEEQFDLDLDAIAPSGKTVKLGGKVYTVFPPKFKQTLQLSKYSSKMQNGKASPEDVEALTDILDMLMPDLKEDNVDLSVEQFGMLIGFILKMAQPTDVTKLQEMGVSISTDSDEEGGEKKSDQAA